MKGRKFFAFSENMPADVKVERFLCKYFPIMVHLPSFVLLRLSTEISQIVYHIAQGIHPLVQHRPHRTCAAVDLAEGERHPVAGPAEGLDGPLAAAGGIGGAARRRRVHVAADYLLVCES